MIKYIFSSGSKPKKKNRKKKKKRKKNKNNKKEATKLEKSMVKKIPNFFGIDSSSNDIENLEEIESAYTELARNIFLEKLEGRSSSHNVYNQMTNDNKLRSVINK